MRRVIFSLFVCTLFGSQVNAQITNTRDLLKEMHKRYNGKFYKHITFIQLNKIFRADTLSETSVWYEAFEYPGKLRVDYGPSLGVNGHIFLNDSVYYFKDGMLEKTEKKINETMLLSGDIFCLPIPEIMSKLTTLGYDTSKFREDKWKGKPAFVIGAAIGDDTTRQFWIDRQYLYLVRHITNDSGQVQEIHFSEHQAKGKFYIEDEVKIMEKGKTIKTERYAEVNPDIVLLPSIFDPKQWGKVHWKTK